jgi:hypothetical protein
MNSSGSVRLQNFATRSEASKGTQARAPIFKIGFSLGQNATPGDYR